MIREDTLTQQVFKYDISNISCNTDTLLFDFSLNAGDPFTACFNLSGGGIDSTQQMTLNNSTTRKILYFSPQGYSINNLNANYMIEGIGGSGGIIRPFQYISVSGSSQFNEIICYRDNGVDLFGSCVYPSYVTAVEDHKTEKNNLSVYPNPANNWLTVKHHLNTTEELVLEIYDINGKQQYSIATTSRETTLDVSGFVQGVYFILIKNNNDVSATQKWVKTN